MPEANEGAGIIAGRLGELSDVDSTAASVDKSNLIWNDANDEWTVKAPGTAIASPTADSASLKTAVDAIRAALTANGITL